MTSKGDSESLQSTIVGTDTEDKVTKCDQDPSNLASTSVDDFVTKGTATQSSDGILIPNKTDLAQKESIEAILERLDKKESEDDVCDFQDDDLDLHWDDDEDELLKANKTDDEAISKGEESPQENLTEGKNSEGTLENNKSGIVENVSDENTYNNTTGEVVEDSMNLRLSETDRNKTDTPDTDSLDNEITDLNIPIENIENNLKPAVTVNDESMSLNDSNYPDLQHGLLKPDQMIEIPTQELIDIDDSCLNDDDDVTENKSENDNLIKGKDKDSEIAGSLGEELIVPTQIMDKEREDIDLKETKDVEAMEVSDVPKPAEGIIQSLKNSTDINIDSSKIENKSSEECTLHKRDQILETEVSTSIKDQDQTDDTTKLNNLQNTIDPKVSMTNEVNKTTEGSEITTIDADKETKSEKNIEEQLLPAIGNQLSVEADPITSEIDPQPSTSTSEVTNQPSEVSDQPEPEDSSEAMEMEDSLGLLAESSRIMDDDEDEEENEGDGEEDDDFEPEDESSNQMTADHSEDSNAVQSESDQPLLSIPIVGNYTPSPGEGEKFEFPTGDGEAEEKDDMLVDEIECEEMEVPSPTSEVDAEKVIDGTKVEEKTEPNEKTDDKFVESTTKPVEKEKSETKITAESVSPAVVDKEAVAEAENKTIEPKPSPSKTMKLSIAQLNHVVNIVDLEESSSEDDVQLIKQASDTDIAGENHRNDVTSVNLPKGIDVMATSAGDTSEIVTRDDEVVINVPKNHTSRVPKLNTSELTIKTIPTTEPTLVIPEAKISDVIEANQTNEEKKKSKLSLEIFSLDSDEDESKEPAMPPRPPTPPPPSRCSNPSCRRPVTSSASPATAQLLYYYRLDSRKRARFCDDCVLVVERRQFELVEGIKSFLPLMELDMEISGQELVEISDSDSDDEGEVGNSEKELVGEDAAKFLDENLADILNETWKRFELDSRLQDTQKEIQDELQRLEKEGAEINEILNECQIATDKLRNELYATFEPRRQDTPAITIYDTPSIPMTIYSEAEERQAAKRRLSSSSDLQSYKRPAIPLGFTETKPEDKIDDIKADDDSQEDVSVVKLCAETAPLSLPPVGELVRPGVKQGMAVFAMRNAFGSWSKAKVLDVLGKAPAPNNQFTQCRVKFEHKIKNPCKVILARSLAYEEPSKVRLTIGTRVIALFKDTENERREAFYSGVVAEIPNPVNHYRYLVFFDDGYAQYVQHQHTRLVVESSSCVWEEVHPFSREFVRQYLCQYPERPMVRLHAGQRLKTEWNGKWWISRVIQVDASLVQVHFEEDNRSEWIYRGSTRLAPLYLELLAAERTRNRPLPRAKGQSQANVPYVEYTRSDEQNDKSAETQQQQQREQEEIRRQRSVAKKSTSTQQVPVAANAVNNSVNANAITSRVVYYTPKNAVKPHKMVPHNCGPRCKRNDVLSLKDLRTYNPLAKPLLSGWERQIVRIRGIKEVMYRAPCGRRIRNPPELLRYLRATCSELPVDLFDFAPTTHCLAEFVLNKCLVGKKDLSHGRENVPVPCVNYYDTSLPEFCSYNTERTPTAGVPLNLDPEFLCGCDCTDDCQDKSKCACWKMTLEGARTIGMGSDVGYVYRRLPEPLPSGIYECNSRCKCKNTCLNRVVQHPLQLKLQVFKTLNRGWGIRSLNDVPKGSFLCIYAGNLLTDATANLDGLNEGDEYLAELDYIEVVEQMKEGYEEDLPAELKEKKDGDGESGTDSQADMTSSDEDPQQSEKDDDDFRPTEYENLLLGGDDIRNRERRSRRRREQKEKKEIEKKKKEGGDDDCITISDDEEVREPSRFTAQAGMDANAFKSKYKSVRSHFGRDEACYIMDAKVQGNIGRYLNHSCCPNVFVQNVFVDTHDPRFPWVAFFALSAIKAGSELTWNYNYDVGSVPGKMLYCYCGAPNCRGRLL